MFIYLDISVYHAGFKIGIILEYVVHKVLALDSINLFEYL